MPALDRQIALRGPKFFRDADGDVKFVHHLDGSTRIGPRDLHPEDREVYAAAWDAFMADEPPEPLKPMVTFATLEGTEKPPAPKAKGSVAPT